jgi:xylan 1,4-beta-xylosidase
MNNSPIIEVSFMPEVIASGPETIFHYKGNITPPKNQTMWTDLIKTLVRHLIDRYGVNEIRQWPFEIWNEPNCGFFSGTQEQYFELMKITREAIKTVDDRIPVGGPATCQSGWINETLAYSAKHNFTLDFISTHLYPTDFGNDVPRDIMYTVLSNVRRTIGPDMPLYYTEYNSGLWCCPERQHDLPYAASFVVSNIPVLAGIADILSYWSFSDIFEEGGFDSAPYQSNYGMTTIYDIPKPVYRAFELLHWSGDTRLAVVPPTVPGNLDVLATRNTTHLQLYVTNFNTWGKPIKAARACITLTGLSYVNRSVPTATLHRIDDHSGNGIKAWEAMGSPAYPTPAQIHAMYEASMMKTSTTSYEYSGGKVSFDVEVPPHGVAHIAVPLSKVH